MRVCFADLVGQVTGCAQQLAQLALALGDELGETRCQTAAVGIHGLSPRRYSPDCVDFKAGAA